MRGSRIVVPAAVRVTLHVYVTRKDRTARMVLDVDGGVELPNAEDLQERQLLMKLDEPHKWRLMSPFEVADFQREKAKEEANEPA